MRMPLTVCLLGCCAIALAQADTFHTPLHTISDHELTRLGDEYDHLAATVQKKSFRFLTILKNKEARLQRQLAGKDSAAAANLFNASIVTYRQLQSALNKVPAGLPLHPLKEYLPGVDSIQTALRFLTVQKLPPGLQDQLLRTESKLMLLQNQLQQANVISAFVQERKLQWQSQLQSYGSGNLLAFEKQTYYYKTQMQQYKDLLHDPDRLAIKVLAVVRELPAYRQFFQHNSYLSTLFRLPGADGETAGQPFAGLQTREQVAAAVAERLGPGANLALAVTGRDQTSPIGGSMQEAQDQLNGLKDRLSATGGSSGNPMPDFQPNPHHDKTFFRRIQLDFNMQSQSSTPLMPAMSTLGLSAGYLLNARSIVGVGAAFKLGWGQPFDHIALSGQGASLRSFLNWKLKSSLWIVGGYELNYLNAFAQLRQLRAISAWQQSALAGLMKPFKAGRRTGNMQLLFDALYKRHVPQSQPIVFRVGYTLN